LLAVSLWAEIPAGYYDTTQGKNQGELKTALYEIIRYADVLNYGSGAGATWSGFPLTDACADGTVWDMYSNQIYQFDGVNSVSGMNIEHSLPKSWWGGTVNQAYKDLHHLNPSDAAANIQKSNWTMGVVDGEVLFDNGVIKRGRSFLRDPANSIIVWEPADEYKGDFARIYMYMVTCYEYFSPNDAWTSDASMQLNVNNYDTYPLFQDWTSNLLLAWNRADPVSTKELKRNEAVYNIQGNRNPFIDCPLLAEYIWGNKKDETFSTALITGQPYITSPITGKQFVFSGDKLGVLQSLNIPISGYNITQSVSVKLFGASASKFTLSRSSLSSADVLAGTSLLVTYNSPIMSQDTVELQCYSEELLDTVRVRLTAEAFDTFRLLDPVIEDQSFTVRWEASFDALTYKVSVFTMSNVGEKAWVATINEDFVNTPNLPLNWTETGYVSKNQLSEIRLASGSTQGSIISPLIEIGDSAQILVRAKQYNTDNGAPLTISCNDVIVGTFVTTVDYQTFKLKIDASAYSSAIFKFAAGAGKRVIIDSVQINSYETIESCVLLGTYPQEETSLNHQVIDLQKGDTYYYTVQPQGGLNTAIYGPIEVVTGATAVPNLPISTVKWQVTSNGLLLENLEPQSTVSVFDALGRVWYSTAKTTSDELQIPLSSQGVFILRINNDAPIKILKSI